MKIKHWALLALCAVLFGSAVVQLHKAWQLRDQAARPVVVCT